MGHKHHPAEKPDLINYVWAVAQSPILGTTITLSRLRQRGHEQMLDQNFNLRYNEPPGTACPELDSGQAVRRVV